MACSPCAATVSIIFPSLIPSKIPSTLREASRMIARSSVPPDREYVGFHLTCVFGFRQKAIAPERVKSRLQAEEQDHVSH